MSCPFCYRELSPSDFLLLFKSKILVQPEKRDLVQTSKYLLERCPELVLETERQATEISTIFVMLVSYRAPVSVVRQVVQVFKQHFPESLEESILDLFASYDVITEAFKSKQYKTFKVLWQCLSQETKEEEFFGGKDGSSSFARIQWVFERDSADDYEIFPKGFTLKNLDAFCESIVDKGKISRKDARKFKRAYTRLFKN